MNRSTVAFILTGILACACIANIVMYTLHTAVWETITYRKDDFHMVLALSAVLGIVSVVCYYVGARYHNEELWEEHFDRIPQEIEWPEDDEIWYEITADEEEL